MFKVLDQWKQIKLAWLHDPSRINTRKRNNVRRETSRYFRNKGRDCPDSKDKLIRSPRENGGGYDAQKDLHSRTGRDEKKGKTQEKVERGSRRRPSAGEWEDGESWWQIGENGRTLFDVPKPTVGFSASGRRRIKRRRRRRWRKRRRIIIIIRIRMSGQQSY